MMLIAAFQN